MRVCFYGAGEDFRRDSFLGSGLAVSGALFSGNGNHIFNIMKLLEQIIGELGGDTLKAFTVVPAFGGYFRSVKSVAEYTPQKIVLLLRKTVLTLEGENMEIGKYFEQDLFIKGNIRVINVE